MMKCSECKKEVKVVDGQVVRACEGCTAPIVAEMKATATGEGGC